MVLFCHAESNHQTKERFSSTTTFRQIGIENVSPAKSLTGLAPMLANEAMAPIFDRHSSKLASESCLFLPVGLTAMVNKIEQDCAEATFTFGIGRVFSHDMNNHARGKIPENCQGESLGRVGKDEP